MNLKSCPFCGSQASLSPRYSRFFSNGGGRGYMQFYVIQCNKCHIEVHSEAFTEIDIDSPKDSLVQQNLISKWNTRV